MLPTEKFFLLNSHAMKDGEGSGFINNYMKIALVQAEIFWEDNDKNLDHFSSILEKVKDVEIFVLPEMFNSGFTTNSDSVGQTMEGKAVCWLQKMATKKDAVFVASLIILENTKRYNRLVWATPNGDTKTMIRSTSLGWLMSTIILHPETNVL